MPAATFGLVGAGWRAEFFLKMALALPDELAAVGVVVRRPEVADRVRGTWGVPTYAGIDALVSAGRPDFVISSVPWDANPGVVTRLVELGIPVLCETPPAPDVDGLRRLWSAVGRSGLVQVAEQYLMLPGHAARLELVRRGAIGQPTSVQVSSTHGYHAVSMIRGLLGLGFAPATVTARRFTAPLVDPRSRDGWTDDDTAEAGDDHPRHPRLRRVHGALRLHRQPVAQPAAHPQARRPRYAG